MEKLVSMLYWTGKLVLVTGASDLVGGHLVKSLISLKSDVADAYLHLGEKALGIRPRGPHNFSNDVAYSVNET